MTMTRRRSRRAGAGPNQFFDRRDHHQQQLALRLFRLLDQCELLGDPVRRRMFAAIEIVQSGQARRAESREILRDRSNFLEQQEIFQSEAEAPSDCHASD